VVARISCYEEQINQQNEQIKQLLARQSASNAGRENSGMQPGNYQTVEPVSNPQSSTQSQSGCYNCGNSGHFSRNCPFPKVRQPRDGNSASHRTGPTSAGGRPRNRVVSAANTAYISTTIDGKKTWCLLDSGSQVMPGF